MLRALLVFFIAVFGVQAARSVFDAPELKVAPSPSAAVQMKLPDGVRVIDSDVSPAGPVVALLTSGDVRLWTIGPSLPVTAFALPAGFRPQSLAWHPLGETLFVTGAEGTQYAILEAEKKGGKWTLRKIYSSRREIRRMVPGPRPFVIHYPAQAYRLFFGLKGNDGTYSIHSITEEGQREYQVVGPKATFTKFADADANPSELTAASALPVGFHPAGHLLLWEDGRHCVQVASYDRDYWKKSAPLLGREACGGTVSVTPNGAGLIHWTQGAAGVELLLQQGSVSKREAAGSQFTATPSSTADGKGIVGITQTGVTYTPIDVPLADSVNAWMYLESGRDSELLSSHGGLFRELNDKDQLYQLYDTESYACGELDESTPTRPYLVTSDSFWELFAAAYEGIFIVRERQMAIPAFWQFVDRAAASPQSSWTPAFTALAALHRNPQSNPEARRILADEGELKPRGHYAATSEAQLYFRAFHYLTQLKLNTNELAHFPPEVKAAAMRWIAPYQDLIAPSRSPLVWQNTSSSPAVVFPLSWGFDNQTMFATIDHPQDPRVPGRLQPSGLDIATVLGSRFAHDLLGDQLRRYPALEGMLQRLASQYQTASRTGIYNQWIDSLATQWAEDTPSPNGPLDADLWKAKRLQTGLASWATLRHATVLVNERVSAECGEAGFEAIVLRPPRGYVEPDPKTFGKIADLFDSAVRLVNTTTLTGSVPQDEYDKTARESLRLGLVRRLNESAAKARLFQAIATKENKGQPLTAQDYEEILYFGRVAEHHFLIFKSLANKDLALSTPNPIPKITDVADVLDHAPYLMAAVGRPLEWDHIVPFFGRHEIVKGAGYSYYEFSSNKLLNDAEWIKMLPAQPHPAWISAFVSPTPLSCPARDPF